MSIRLIVVLFVLMFVNQCVGVSYGAFREGFRRDKLDAGLWRYATVLAGYAAIALTVWLAKDTVDGIEYLSGLLLEPIAHYFLKLVRKLKRIVENET
jgi:hypothetical protein